MVPGTTRLTDLGALIETMLGEDIAGGTIRSVYAQGTLIGTVGGVQGYGYGLFVGPNSLDPADVFPSTAPQNLVWWKHQFLNHRGQQHNVLAAAAEFTEHFLHMRTRGPRRLAAVGQTLWFADETQLQTQNASWTFRVVTRGA